jgi:hypothetical protein
MASLLYNIMKKKTRKFLDGKRAVRQEARAFFGLT